MAERQGDDPIAPRRSLSGPILPPPPPELAEEAARKQAAEAKKKEKQARAEAKRRAAEQRAAEKERQRAARRAAQAQKRAQKQAEKPAQKPAQQQARPQRSPQPAARVGSQTSAGPLPGPASWGTSGEPAASQPRPPAAAPPAGARSAPRQRRARLRLAQVDAWSVMKTAFLLSIALGIVCVVAVLVIWSVLGSAGVWDSVNATVRQAIGSEQGSSFNIEDYLGTSRVVGFTMIVAVIDVILITAIATLGAFLYNLAAALLGGIEVTLTEER